MSTRPHPALLLLLAGALTAGCGGPDRPLQVGVKEVPSNVVLGAQSSPEPAPVAPSAGPVQDFVPLPPPPSVLTLPPPPLALPAPDRPVAPPLPPPSPAACPAADPLEAPAVEAPSTISARPAKAQYLFRTTGTFEQSGADARRGSFPERSLRTVSGAFENSDGSGFAFSVTETLADITTTTEYLVVTGQPLPTDPEPGLYVARISSSSGSDFQPTPSLRLAAFPLVRGATLESRGVDPGTATAMSFTSTVAGKARVDACGVPLDSFTLELTDGRVLSPSQDLTFESTLALGTQFGGLVLRESTSFAGETDGAGVSRSLLSTINQVPKTTAGPQP